MQSKFEVTLSSSYQATTKGRSFLDAYCKLEELMRADAHWLLEENGGAAKEAEEGAGE